MMAVLARKPIDLDQLLNEGVAHTIRMFTARTGELPVGMQPVMIGRRARRYNTVAKVSDGQTQSGVRHFILHATLRSHGFQCRVKKKWCLLNMYYTAFEWLLLNKLSKVG